MSGVRIGAVRLACPDVGATLAFYRRAFGGEVAAPGEAAAAALRLGRQRLEFVAAAAGPAGPPPASNETSFQHCAIIVAGMDEAMARLGAVPGWSAISTAGPERLPAASGGVTAFKFRDPDGHPLEFLQFPAGAVPEPFASAAGGPVLGIDHSAITVADAERSIAFYETLGFRLADRQLNRGPEQGRMDGFGPVAAAVEVVTLRPAGGGAPPHLELLCYRDPPTVAAPAAEGSPFATALRLDGLAAAPGGRADPDGHRLVASAGD